MARILRHPQIPATASLAIGGMGLRSGVARRPSERAAGYVDGQAAMFDALADLVIGGFASLSDVQKIMVIRAAGGPKQIAPDTLDYFFGRNS